MTTTAMQEAFKRAQKHSKYNAALDGLDKVSYQDAMDSLLNDMHEREALMLSRLSANANDSQ